MSSDTSANNKRIAKNTLLLYFRMIILMLVSLYTSRVVLDVLGITDFGIYNVVGGIVAMLGFLSNAMSNAAQRFLSFEIGRGNQEGVANVFNLTFWVHFSIAVIVVLAMETVGVWYLENYLNIPAERVDAAHWVLQCTIITMFLHITQVPYNAMIIAHERMGVYAYVSILEVVLKLAIVYMLLVFGFDHLKLYGVLVMLVSILIMLIYCVYCMKIFPESRLSKIRDWRKLREMLSFAGWNMFGEVSWAFCGQGVNIILNLFFGPSVNAARGIAEQVNAAVNRFVSSFQTAVNPQLIKTYASNQLDEMKLLLNRSTRFSYYLLLVISMPLILCMDTILHVWLVEVPEYTTAFCQLILICMLASTISNLLAQVAKAYGKIRKYQLVVSFCIFLNFPLSYLCLHLGFSPLSTVIVNIAIQCGLLFVRLYLIKDMIGLSISKFTIDVVVPIVKVTLIALIVPIAFILYSDNNLVNQILLVFIAVVSAMLSSYYVGMTQNERVYVTGVFKKITNKFLKA